jgi:hypothetical protein
MFLSLGFRVWSSMYNFGFRGMSRIECWKLSNVSANVAAAKNAQTLHIHPNHGNCNVCRWIIFNIRRGLFAESRSCTLDFVCSTEIRTLIPRYRPTYYLPVQEVCSVYETRMFATNVKQGRRYAPILKQFKKQSVCCSPCSIDSVR